MQAKSTEDAPGLDCEDSHTFRRNCLELQEVEVRRVVVNRPRIGVVVTPHYQMSESAISPAPTASAASPSTPCFGASFASN